MTHRSELINLIAQRIKAETYLEIGVFNPDHNFNKIQVPVKIGVDPDPAANALVRYTSDEYFAIMKATGARVDLVFIDGLHHADQVQRDIKNAWDVLNEGGVIVLHDCNPPTEATTCVPRGAQREWCGDVYKTIARIIYNPEVVFTVDFDYGCCVIRKCSCYPFSFHYIAPTWEQFEADRKGLLRLKSVEEATEIINTWNPWI